MSELCAWDLDYTIRPNGSLMGDAVEYGIAEGFLDPEQFLDPQKPIGLEVDYFVAALTGLPYRTFRSLAKLVGNQAREEASPWALAELEAQAAEGYHPIILSHSPDFLVKAFAQGLGCIKDARGTRLLTNGRFFTGRYITSPKHHAAIRYMREKGLEVFGYAAGDSMADVPLLERARRPVAVDPSKDLETLAIEKGWEIVNTGSSA